MKLNKYRITVLAIIIAALGLALYGFVIAFPQLFGICGQQDIGCWSAYQLLPGRSLMIGMFALIFGGVLLMFFWRSTIIWVIFSFWYFLWIGNNLMQLSPVTNGPFGTGQAEATMNAAVVYVLITIVMVAISEFVFRRKERKQKMPGSMR